MSALLLGLAALAQAPTEGAAADEPSATEVRMVAHFEASRDALDALVAGDLEVAKAQGETLAALPVGEAPAAWGQALVSVRTAGAALATATNLDEAAGHLGRLTAACAGCHESLAAGPRFDPAQQPEAEAQLDHMARHRWGLVWMWLGLIAPSDEAWRRGTAALADLEPWGHLGSTGVDVPSHLWRGDETVHAQALRAEAAPGVERAEHFARIVAGCARCHVERRTPVTR